jgi:hypothetical protein
VIDEHQRRIRARLRGLDLPAEPTRRAAAVLARLAGRITANAERANTAKRLPSAPPSEPASDVVVLNRAVVELWNFRDDCHIGAWRAAGYDGPSLDVLTQVWPGTSDVRWATQGGKGTLDEIAKALEAKQDRADVERRIEALERRGDIAREGTILRITPQGQRARDGIEEDTDRRFFALWELDDAATARLGDDLLSAMDALPKA